MAEVRKPQRRNARKSGWMLALVVLVLLVLAVGTLHALDVVHVPFLPGHQTKAAEQHAGEIPVPIAVRVVREFAQVQREDLVDPKTGQVAFRYVKESEAKDRGFITKFGDAVGRVMKFEKQAGYAFKESDFYPPGSSASPTLAIGIDKRGTWVDATKIEGLDALNRGDRFQIYAMLSARDTGDTSKTEFADAKTKAEVRVQAAWATDQQVIVREGRVIVALPKGPGAKSAGQRMFLEVAPGEEVALGQALTKGAKVYCAALSTLPGAPPVPVDPATKPSEPSHDQIEILNGKSPRNTIVPAKDEDAGGAPPKEDQR